MKSNPTQHCRNLRMNNSSCSDEGTSERNVKLSINSVSRPQVRQHCQRRYFQDRRKEKQKHAKHQFSPSYTVQHIPIHIHSPKFNFVKKIRQIELIFFGLEFCGVKLVGTHLALPDKLCRSFAINIWTTFLSSLTLLSMPLLFSIQGQTLYYVALFPI